MLISTIAYGQEKLIGVRYSQFTTMVFPADIVDLEIGSAEYIPKIKGKYLLLKAKSKQANPTSLMVRYGEERQGYVVGIMPNDKAPMVVHIDQMEKEKEQLTDGKTANQQTPEAIFQSQSQDYYTLGLKKHGLIMMITSILNSSNVTYLYLFVENQNALPCLLSKAIFEYVYTLRSFLFFNKERREVVTPLQSPKTIQLPPYSYAYFVLAIPAQGSADGLSLSLVTQEGAKNYSIYIPSKVLLGAKHQ